MGTTEEEAKTKLCFRAATFAASQQVHNGPGPNCVGSACMAWRCETEESFQARWEAWDDASNIGGITSRGPEPVINGFCGLAGAPQQ